MLPFRYLSWYLTCSKSNGENCAWFDRHCCEGNIRSSDREGNICFQHTLIGGALKKFSFMEIDCGY